MTKTVFITGCDRGLGLALATKFLELHYIVFAGKYMNDWPELDELRRKNEERLHVISLDVRDDKSVKDAKEYIKRHVYHLDILINNAAIFTDRSSNIFGEINYEDMNRVFDTNVFGPLRVTHAVMPLLLKGENKMLVNISSEAGSITDCWRKEEFGYSMSKSALNMQSAILQNDLRDYGVKVLAIHPGYVRSYMLGKLNSDATVEPLDSALGIVNQVLNPPAIDGPVYIDYEGNQLNW